MANVGPEAGLFADGLEVRIRWLERVDPGQVITGDRGLEVEVLA